MKICLIVMYSCELYQCGAFGSGFLLFASVEWDLENMKC